MKRCVSVASWILGLTALVACSPSVVSKNVRSQDLKTAAPVTVAKSACESAALALLPDAVVGKVNGQAILAKDLGTELEAQEKSALQAYCRAISDARSNALRDVLATRVLEEAARGRGTSASALIDAK